MRSMSQRPNHSCNEHLRGLHKRIEAALEGLGSPTQEVAEKTVRELLPSNPGDTAALVPFTGYYGIDTAPGAFLSIDTSEMYINYPLTQRITINLHYPVINIEVSLDGRTSTSCPFANGGSFDGKTLTIPGVLSVDLTRGYQAGRLVTLSGTIQDVQASGATFFNPVELPVFVGSYTSEKTATTVLTVERSSLRFDSGSGLQNVPFFTYNPAMYVVQFLAREASYVLMLGTAGPSGLACFITDGTTQNFAVTIPQA